MLREREVEGIYLYIPYNIKKQEVDPIKAQCQAALQTGFQEFLRQSKANQMEVPEAPYEKLSQLLMGGLMATQTSQLAVLDLTKWDKLLFQHSLDTAMIALFATQVQGYTGQELLTVGMGMFFHDYGQTLLPPHLYHSTQITEDDVRWIEQHPQLGYAKLCALKILEPVAADIVLHHHERKDGTGYPDGLSGNAIQPLTQIACVVEQFDLMHGSGVGRTINQSNVVRQIWKEAERAYGKEVAFAVMNCVTTYPAGTPVLLNTGEIGLVVSATMGQATLPKLRVFYSADGQRTRPVDIDLIRQPEYQIMRTATTIEELKKSA
jgi:HD-GYP domain-containing protein (c-di-GMP phosphodiesterase class II)